MTYKTLLSVHRTVDTLETLMPAARVALELEAHLDVIVLQQAAVLPTMVLANDMPHVSGEAFVALLDQTDERVKQVRERLGEEGVRSTVVPACQQLGLMAETVAQSSVYADLVLMHADRAASAALFDRALEGALLRAGRPILLTPRPDDAVPIDPDLAVIGWDESPQAARAVQAALPLLERASSVRVLMLADADRIYERRAHMIDDWMSRHGVDVTVERVLRDGAIVAHALHDHVKTLSPDLLVMGAYGHGRLRERVLGGTTHVMLHDLPCATLLAA